MKVARFILRVVITAVALTPGVIVVTHAAPYRALPPEVQLVLSVAWFAVGVAVWVRFLCALLRRLLGPSS
jgi:hypothetical protein